MDPLDRIAAALERLAPPPPEPADPLAHPAYRWRGGAGWGGALDALALPDALPLDALQGIGRQKALFVANLRRLAAGRPAHDALLWGARGTGKSALVRSAHAAVRAEGGDVALVAVADADVLEPLMALLADVPRAFLLFVDDFGADDPAAARRLRSLLDGGAGRRSDKVRLAVTANRRHLRARDLAADAAAVNARDEADDQLALADRFGLSLGFHVLDQDAYLAAVRWHLGAAGLELDEADALAWAAGRGNRSGRVARQYAAEVAGRG